MKGASATGPAGGHQPAQKLSLPLSQSGSVLEKGAKHVGTRHAGLLRALGLLTFHGRQPWCNLFLLTSPTSSAKTPTAFAPRSRFIDTVMSCDEAIAASSDPTSSPVNDEEFTSFPESSFFLEQRAAALPSPAEVRSINQATGNLRASLFNRPTPVIIPSLGLFVKYGADVTLAEIETQIFMRERLQDHNVPIPEVFGHAQNGGQRFIYMALMEGETFQERFANLVETERQAVCAELRGMVATWQRVLTQDEADRYIGKPLTAFTSQTALVSSQAVIMTHITRELR